MYRNLLVPLDGSALGEQALAAGCAIARGAGAALHLVHAHVLDSVYVQGRPAIDGQLRARGQEHERAYLARVRERLAATCECAITCAEIDADGSVAAALARYAATNAIDLVVMTTHGRGGLGRLWLGSVADALVRCGPAPILLLRPAERPAEDLRRPLFTRVLIPLDGSALAEQIIAPALALGDLAQAEYRLVRVVVPLTLTGYAPMAQAAMLDARLTQEAQSDARGYLDEVAQRLCAEGRQVRSRVLIGEPPAAMILDEAREQGADLIAIATHARGGLPRLLLGSVADKLLRGATAPVLMYRPRTDG